jgi:hypothetical protein
LCRKNKAKERFSNGRKEDQVHIKRVSWAKREKRVEAFKYNFHRLLPMTIFYDNSYFLLF